ncbi:MAG: cadherin-like beta sandwich domain-containing protein [Gammaproteobacteria bacterium]|nr:cadherin-like beta sandwich domain-containing protein [Gammaproteobacteria bacterium]
MGRLLRWISYFLLLVLLTACGSAEHGGSSSANTYMTEVILSDDVTLDQPFDRNTTDYTASVANNVTSFTLTPAAEDPNSTITINGQTVVTGRPSPAFPLEIGRNVIVMVVTAADGRTQRAYTFVVTREAGVNANLVGLTLSTGTLDQSFNTNLLEYTATVPNAVSSISLVPTSESANSTIAVNGIPVNSGQTSASISLAVGSTAISVVVTAQDDWTQRVYRLTVTRSDVVLRSNNANLFSLNANGVTLSPAFSPSVTYYTASVANNVSSLALTPKLVDSRAGVTVNSSVAVDGQSSNVALNVGDNPITVLVTAEDGFTQKNYTLLVKRQARTNADLSNLVLLPAGMSPAFSAGVFSYSLSVADTVHSVSLTPVLADNAATVKINGLGVPGGVASSVAVSPGSNQIRVQVIAQDGVTTNTYVVNISRASVVNVDLASLALSTGAMGQPFSSGTTAYSQSVANNVSSVTVTPTLVDPAATMKVNNVAVASGASSGSIALNVGNNTITVVVTGSDGVTQKIYSVTVTRSSGLSSNANLSALTLSSGTLSPVFDAATTSYTAAVANTVSTLTLTPTLADNKASVLVNNAAASTPVSLAVGSNTISVMVMAENGSSKTYTVAVTRAASTNTNLSALQISTGAYSPAFEASVTSYNQLVANTITSVTVTASTELSVSSLKINNVAVTSGQPSAVINLITGLNAINVTVIAQDGINSKNYVLNITRLGSSNANLSNLVFSSGALLPAFSSGTTTYSQNLPYAIASLTVTPTLADLNATSLKINGADVLSGTVSNNLNLNVGANTINTVVVAEDGTTSKTYAVTVNRAAPAADANLAALTISNGVFLPAFAAATTSYSVSVANSVSALVITPTANDSKYFSITVAGAATASGSANSVNLAVGTNVVKVIVTAEDGITSKTYTLNITRAAGSSTALILHPSSLANNPGSYSVTGGTWADAMDSNDGDTSYASRCCTGPTVKFWMDMDDATGLSNVAINGVTVHAVVKNTSTTQDVNIGYMTDGVNTVWQGATSVTAGSYVLVSSSKFTTDSAGGTLDLADIDNLQIAVDRIGTGPSALRVTEIYATVDYTVIVPTKTVCSAGCDYSTIQSAVDGVAAGTLIEVSNGSYPEAITIGSKSLTIRSKNGAALTSLIGNYTNAPVVTFNGAASAVLDGFTIDNGYANGCASRGVVITNGSGVTISNSVITNNQIQGLNATCVGAGILAQNNTGEIVLHNSSVSSNTSKFGAGGIMLDHSSMTITGVTHIDNNSVVQGEAGAILAKNGSSLNINASGVGSSTISGNSVYGRAAGVSFDGSAGGSLAIANITINGNTAPNNYGGGVTILNTPTLTTITSSNITGNTAKSGGGGIYASASPLSLQTVNVENNSTTQGGGAGVWITGGSTSIVDSNISHNSSNYGGIGLYMDGSATATLSISGSNFDSNNTVGNPFSFGGGMYLLNIAGITSISDTSASFNDQKTGGGGIYASGAPLNLTNVKANGNRLSQGSGGGLWVNTGSVISFSQFNENVTASSNGGGIYATAALVIDRTEIRGNTASNDGGGLFSNADLTMTNSVVSGNVTSVTVCCGRDGGGIHLAGTTTTSALTNVTVAGNASQDFAGIYVAGGSTMINNSILYGNTAATTGDGDDQLNKLGTVTLNYSVIQDGWTGSGSNNLMFDPAFVDLQQAVGATPTSLGDYRLCLNANTPEVSCPDTGVTYPSMAIDSVPSSSSPQTVDVRGYFRAVDVAGVGADGSNFYDRGAYEMQSGSENYTNAGIVTARKASATSILVTMPYSSDANADNTYTVEYKLATDSAWTTWVSNTGHVSDAYTTTITGLASGATYDVRATYLDTDGVGGDMVQTVIDVLLQ